MAICVTSKCRRMSRFSVMGRPLYCTSHKTSEMVNTRQLLDSHVYCVRHVHNIRKSKKMLLPNEPTSDVLIAATQLVCMYTDYN